MNKKRRKTISEAGEHLVAAENLLSVALDDERWALSNYPESLQTTDQYSDGEDACDSIEDAIDSIRYIKETMSNI